MNNMLLRSIVFVYGVGTLVVLMACCILPDGETGYDSGGICTAYDEPYGVDYGGWGPDYQVAPYRGSGHRRPTGGGGPAATRAYRSAPASRSMPSLPSHGGGGARRR
jgi:hypothetical protein